MPGKEFLGFKPVLSGETVAIFQKDPGKAVHADFRMPEGPKGDMVVDHGFTFGGKQVEYFLCRWILAGVGGPQPVEDFLVGHGFTGLIFNLCDERKT